jgi:hypothetical protein
MGGASSQAKAATAETELEKLHTYIAQLEIDVALTRKKHAEGVAIATARYNSGNAAAAKAIFATTRLHRQQELVLINTITLVHRNINRMNAARIGKETLGIMKTAARSLHDANIDPGELDRISEELHDRDSHTSDHTLQFAEHSAHDGDDEEWDAFLQTIDTGVVSPPPAKIAPYDAGQPPAVPFTPLPQVAPAYTPTASRERTLPAFRL